MSSKKINMSNAITNSNVLLKLFCSLTIVVLICILIGKYAFKNGLLTCDHYIFNTYLYVILSILLIFIIVLINDQTGIFNSFLLLFTTSNTLIILILLLIILLLLVYALQKVNPANIFASNMIWLLLILVLGITVIPVIWFGRLTNIVGLAGAITILTTLVVGVAGYYYGDKIITFDWDKYLQYALYFLIFAAFIGIFFISPKNIYTYFFVISIISLVIFALMLLSNHKKIKENADKCIDGQVVPNYPLESFGIFIKMLNIFLNLIRILGRRYRKY